MKRPMLIATLLLVVFNAFSQPASQFVPDSVTKALWHFNEYTGSSVRDTTYYANNGTAYGTTIVQGRFGNARAFDGYSDYVYIPKSTSLNVGNSSFSIDVWFKTTSTQGIILRKGLVPMPGYQISMFYGHVAGIIGNYQGNSWSDTLLMIVSNGVYSDGSWHLASFTRDRTRNLLLLSIDGVQDAFPLEDSFPLSLDNDQPLTIGAWEYGPSGYWAGSIDEVRLSGLPIFTRPVIVVSPYSLNFGKNPLFSIDSLSLRVANAGTSDTLQVTGISSNDGKFQIASSQFAVPPGSYREIQVQYLPTSVGIDSGIISITSNDTTNSTMRIPVRGVGVLISEYPIIDTVAWDAYNYSIAHVSWWRSTHDSRDDVDPLTQYSVWRGVSGTWEFVAVVPALQFNRYSIMADRGIASYPNLFTIFMVAAQTKNGLVYQSSPDTVLWDPPTSVKDHTSGPLLPKEIALHQNYPNPFNPSTTITYTLTRTVHVTLAVYNTLGERVTTLVDEDQQSGERSVVFDASSLASGVYIYRLFAGTFVQSRKLVLLR